eukprot:365446-Chlamydomonas_euryale.AAC.5
MAVYNGVNPVYACVRAGTAACLLCFSHTLVNEAAGSVVGRSQGWPLPTMHACVRLVQECVHSSRSRMLWTAVPKLRNRPLGSRGHFARARVARTRLALWSINKA